MAIPFRKYQGTGNDFILIDNRQQVFNKNNTTQVAAMCDRRFGIGADGLILLENHDRLDFHMVYYNSDGNPSSMCGNGGRCIVHFARELGVITGTAHFMAVDGEHRATITNNQVSLQMQDVATVQIKDNACFLNTGSPHHVTQVEAVMELPNSEVHKTGRAIRNQVYGQAGANVNFVTEQDDFFQVRTYERGVEAETLSCGTGVTAVALAVHYLKQTTSTQVKLETRGGMLSVQFTPTNNGYKDVYLIGPATFVFQGQWN